MAVKRLYVHRSRYDEVVDGLSQRLAKVHLGHGLDADTTMGPLHQLRQRDYVRQLVDGAAAHGAEVREFAELPDDRAWPMGTSCGRASCWIRTSPCRWSSRSSSARPCR